MNNKKSITMNTTIKGLFALVITVFAFSCGHHTETEHDHTKSGETSKHQHHNQLTLDNGSRWKANPETTEGINNMIALMDSFSDTEDVSAYGPLQDSLQAEFNMIIQKCTMKGEAHNQLHNYLLPMKEVIAGLSTSDLDNNKSNYKRLKEQLAEYSDYFE